MILILSGTLTIPPLLEHVTYSRIGSLTLLRTGNFEFRAPLRLNR